MATTQESLSSPTKKPPSKSVDLPPYGDRNADPITGAPGAHPIETGVGAALGGAAAGALAGAVGGPLGAVAGAIIGGAAAGGLAGHGVGELIDPTSEDAWVREHAKSHPHPPSDEELDAFRRAFRYGMASQARYPGRMFRDVEDELRAGWEDSGETAKWSTVYESVRVGFDRTSYSPGPMPQSASRRV